MVRVRCGWARTYSRSPISSRRRAVLGCRTSPRNSRSKVSCPSSTITLAPRLARSKPRSSPAGPPPTTQTSVREGAMSTPPAIIWPAGSPRKSRSSVGHPAVNGNAARRAKPGANGATPIPCRPGEPGATAVAAPPRARRRRRTRAGCCSGIERGEEESRAVPVELSRVPDELLAVPEPHAHLAGVGGSGLVEVLRLVVPGIAVEAPNEEHRLELRQRRSRRPRHPARPAGRGEGRVAPDRSRRTPSEPARRHTGRRHGRGSG